MKSIHVIINGLAQRYAALDSKRRTTQIVRANESRKLTSVANEKRKADERKPAKKRSRTQGASRKGAVATTPTEIDDDKYDVAGANAVSFLEQFETADAEDTFLASGTTVINCKKCLDAGTDTSVPQVLVPLRS